MQARTAMIPLVLLLSMSTGDAQESEWIAAARSILEPTLSAEYDREMTGIVAYAGNQSVAQVVSLAFPLNASEMASWQQRFAAALEEAGADSVDITGDEVEAENVPASPRPAQRITCTTGENNGEQGIACTSVFVNVPGF